jgi:uncharacterized membrane protein
MKLNTNRMEALVDGIFAIVMTVMIISLNEVLNLAHPTCNGDFYKLFSSIGDDFVIYALSFLILGALWFEHHWQFHFIKRIDPMLVFINIIWFIFLCVVPFSTMLFGNFYTFFVPVFVFELNIFIVFMILHIHWLYATHQGRLTEAPLDKKILSRHGNFGLFLIIIMLFVIILTVVFHANKRF